MSGRAMTVREALKEASSFLAAAGVHESGENAELLMQHVLGWDRSAFLLRRGEPFPEERRDEWQRAIGRKAAGEPVQYITGEQEFYGLPFRVTPAVLIPRPETELLVEQIVARGSRLWPAPDDPGRGTDAANSAVAPVCLDIGSGSGAIAVTIAVQRPQWQVIGSDISEDALEIAQENARRNGVADRVDFRRGDLLAPYVEAGERIDILVSNPPYIPSADVPELQREVSGYEPHTALDGGDDGLHPYRRMTAQLLQLPALPRLVGFEVGYGQADDVAQLLRQTADWATIDIVPDYAGIPRHVIAER